MHPFFSSYFVDVWLKYYALGREKYFFNSLQPVQFVKSRLGLYYYNVGKNITNGIFYTLKDSKDIRGKVFLIYDVLPYLHGTNHEAPKITIRKIPQYNGYLTDISLFENFDDYFIKHFSGKSRNNIRKWDKKLNAIFDIDFKVYYGNIEVAEYNDIFDSLLELIGKRWEQLGLENDILESQDYYRELCYKMVLEKTASINVLSANSKPIAISICFASNKGLYFAITSFDIDFKKFNLGHLMIMNIIKWCFSNGFEMLDYSKGKYDYKTRWSTSSYTFENHILYDRNNFWAKIVGSYWTLFFQIKQSMREKKLNLIYSRLKYLSKRKMETVKNESLLNISDVQEGSINSGNLSKITNDSPEISEIRPHIYELLYTTPQPYESLEIFKVNGGQSYLVKGDDFIKRLDF